MHIKYTHTNFIHILNAHIIYTRRNYIYILNIFSNFHFRFSGTCVGSFQRYIA